MNHAKQKVILFGVGEGGKNGFKYLKRSCDVIGFVDNDKRKQGGTFLGLPVHAPDTLTTLEYDRIVICSMYVDEIQDQLNLQLEIPFEKIDVLDPDIRLYGPGNLVGCILTALGLLVGIGFGIYRLITWIVT